jgi:ELWxxDGT repeat protein
MRRSFCFLFLLLSVSRFLGAAPSLLRDLNTGPAGYAAPVQNNGLTDDSGVLYFAGADPAHGRELWRSDGTEAGTYRLADICPGPCASDPVPLRIFGGRLYLSAGDGESGRELWSLELASGRVERVRDLCPGPCSGDPGLPQQVGSTGVLVFPVHSGNDLFLWRTDGTGAGTEPFYKVCESCPFEGIVLRRVGARLIFNRSDGELWRTDGTAEGTKPVRPDFAGIPYPFAQVTLLIDGDHAFFLSGDILYRTDLTPAGTVAVRNLAEIVDNPALPHRFSSVAFRDGQLYGLLDSRELIRSDGTHDGTIRLGLLESAYSLGIFALSRGVVVFDDTWNLWRTDGTPGSTVKILDIRAGSSDFVDSAAQVGDRVFFSVVRWGDGTHLAWELWTSDGTAAGTRRITAAPDRIVSFENPPQPAHGPFYFLGSDAAATGGPALWRSDGTEGGTFQVYDFGDRPAASGPLAQIAFGARVLFSARTSLTAAPLFATDGTPAGTRLVSAAPYGATAFARAGSQLFFNAGKPATPTSVGVQEIWRTDGTAAGTRRLASGRSIASPFPLGNLLLFSSTRSTGLYNTPEAELFRSDGRAAGTFLVKDINPYLIDSGFHHTCAYASSNPGPGIAIGNRAVFAADDGVHGRELWTTDGTRQGTRLLEDLDPRRVATPPDNCADEPDDRTDSGLSSDPAGFVAFRNGALFAATDAKGRELWWTNGTAAGTRRLSDVLPGPASSSPHDLTVAGGKAYFVARGTGTGEALWRTDGTTAGTVQVADLALGGEPSFASELTAVGSRLFFTVYNDTTGRELWVSGGDAGSTHLVVDLRPGPRGSAPQALREVRGVLVFAADDGVSGLEPWRSDGTAAGTRRLGDIAPGADGSAPGPFDLAGNVVITGADDGVHGREPWAIPIRDVTRP